MKSAFFRSASPFLAIFCLVVTQAALIATPLSSARADLDPASEEALAKTQALLRDQNQRDKSLTTPEAKSTDKQVKDLMGDDSQALYELAADIFPALVNGSGGDSSKMQEKLEKMKKNPDDFASMLTKDQLQKLKALAAKVEGRQPSSSPR